MEGLWKGTKKKSDDKKYLSLDRKVKGDTKLFLVSTGKEGLSCRPVTYDSDILRLNKSLKVISREHNLHVIVCNFLTGSHILNGCTKWRK